MLEGLREALNYVVDLGKKSEEPKVLEICNKTYATRNWSAMGNVIRQVLLKPIPCRH